jgi:hypothetical protein
MYASIPDHDLIVYTGEGGRDESGVLRPEYTTLTVQDASLCSDVVVIGIQLCDLEVLVVIGGIE